jgi:hypothetical protein
MSLEASAHWKWRRRYRPDITDREIVLAITRGVTERDSRPQGVLRATMRIPPSGRTLRVVYRITGPRRYMIITAFWLHT